MAGAAEADPPGLLHFDALTEIGPRLDEPIAQRWRLDDLKSEREHCSISGVLVSYTLSTGYKPNHP